MREVAAPFLCVVHTTCWEWAILGKGEEKRVWGTSRVSRWPGRAQRASCCGMSWRRLIRSSESGLQDWTAGGYRLRIYPIRTKLSLTALRSELLIPGKNQGRLNHAWEWGYLSRSLQVTFCDDSWSSFNWWTTVYCPWAWHEGCSGEPTDLASREERDMDSFMPVRMITCSQDLEFRFRLIRTMFPFIF